MTFAFTGVVSNVAPSLFTSGSNFNSSQLLSGSYTFNDLTSDQNDASNIARYDNAITGLTVNIGGSYSATLVSPGSGFIAIQNNPIDRYMMQAPVTSSSPSLVHGYSPVRFRLELIDPSGTAFSSDPPALVPTTPPSLSSFAANRWRFVFEDGSGKARIQGSLSSLTAVPLPAAVILFGAGIVALVGLGAGSWRKRKNSLA